MLLSLFAVRFGHCLYVSQLRSHPQLMLYSVHSIVPAGGETLRLSQIRPIAGAPQDCRMTVDWAMLWLKGHSVGALRVYINPAHASCESDYMHAAECYRRHAQLHVEQPKPALKVYPLRICMLRRKSRPHQREVRFTTTRTGLGYWIQRSWKYRIR